MFNTGNAVYWDLAVQKSALRIILKQNYKTYTNALNVFELNTLENRRELLCLEFAKKCVKNPKSNHIFPLNSKDHQMITRDQEKYMVHFANTVRLQNSPILYMQTFLNQNEKNSNENSTSNNY